MGKKKKTQKKIKGGAKKVSEKKLSKAQWMWIEQILLDIDAIKSRLSDVEKSIKLIKEKLGLNSEVR